MDHPEVKAPVVNIEEIMREIRKEAEALRYEEPVSFEAIETPAVISGDNGGDDFDLRKCENALGRANAIWHIPYGHEIAGNPVKKILGRAARKLNRPTGAPMAQDISDFNAEITQTLNEMLRFIRATQKKQEEQERRIFDLEAEIRQLKEGTEKKA